MKLITIEEPEKSILEPLSESAESPMDAPPVLGEKAAPSTLPSIVESEGDAEVKNEALNSQDVKVKKESPEGSCRDGTQPSPPVPPKEERSPLTRKRSGRIRTRSKVETPV